MLNIGDIEDEALRPQFAGDVLENPTPHSSGKGWEKIHKLFDGLGGTVDRIADISESGKGIALDVAEGKTAIDKANTKREQAEAKMFLDNVKVMRGDNKIQYAVIGVALLGFIVLATK